MNILRILNGKPEAYSLRQLRRDNPQVSFPEVPSADNWASYDNAAVVTDRAADGFAAGHVSPLDTVTAAPSGLADFTFIGSDGTARHAAISLTPS